MTKNLPLDLEFFENIVIYNALFDQVYLETVIHYIKPSYFKDKHLKNVFDSLIQYYSEHKKVPNITELKIHLVDQDKRDSLKEAILKFKTIDKKYDKETLLKNTERFIKEKAVLSSVLKTSLDIQTGNIDPSKILKEFETACNISIVDNNGFDYLESIDQHCEDIQKVFSVVPTGWKWLDEKIGGGFMADGRALYVFFGVTNVGKSIFLGNIATNLLSQDKTVVLISLEMPEQVYAKRISSQLSKIPFSDLSLQVDPLKKYLNQYKIKNKNAKLIIKEFPPKTVTPVHIKNYIEKLVRSGINPNAIVLDYLNLLAPNTSGLNSYEAVKEITEHVRALSYNFSCPVISATQANRSAFSTPNPDMDMTSESMGLSHTVDAQFSIWTEEEDFDLGIIHMGIVKNRFGPRQCHTVLEIDYETLSLKDPDEIAKSFTSKVTPEKKNKDSIIGMQDDNITNTLNLIENLGLSDEK
jgi:replicative DNA helicase